MENLIYWGADGESSTPRIKQFLNKAKDIVPRSVWDYFEVGSTQEATDEFKLMFPAGGFDYPNHLDSYDGLSR